MSISRRSFVQSLGLGVAATVVPARFEAFEPQRERVPGSNSTILLNSNENAYGPSEKVMQAMQDALSSANRYVSRQRHDELVHAIAELHSVAPDRVLPGSGSSEILRVACNALLRPGDRLVVARPTYEGVSFYGQSLGAEIVPVPLNRAFAHDLSKMLASIDAKKPTLVYICNPNNPTATLTARKDIDAFLENLPANAHVLIDEAYHHFAEPSAYYVSFLDRPVDHPRVIVTRTFSKIYGLAGMRLGYGVASPEVVQKMRPFMTNFGVNIAAAAAAIAALQDHEALKPAIKRNADDRQEFFNEATGRALKPLPSHTNFAMTNAGLPAQQVIDHFRSHNILIGRRFPPMDTFVRISFGLPAEMQQFWRVWDMLGLHPKGHH